MHDDRGRNHHGRNHDRKAEAVAGSIHFADEVLEVAVNKLDLQPVGPRLPRSIDPSVDRTRQQGPLAIPDDMDRPAMVDGEQLDCQRRSNELRLSQLDSATKSAVARKNST
jgi:hypothetical protein